MNIRLAAGAFAGIAMAAVAGAASAQDFTPKEAGTWIINTRITTVDPTANDDIFTTPGGADTTLNAVVDSGTMPTLGFTYFLTDNVAVEAILGTTKHEVRAVGAATNLPVAETWVLPPVVAVQYHFAPDQKISPYVGAGVNYMLFYSEKNLGAFTGFDVDNGLGYALQAGVDVALQGNWSLNLDVKKIYFDTTAHTTLAGPGRLVSDVSLDPWAVSLGFGYRFAPK